MEIRKLLAVVIVLLFVPAFAALAFGQASSSGQAAGAQPGMNSGTATDSEDMNTDMGADRNPLVEPPGGPDLRPREGTSPPPQFGTPSRQAPGAAGTEPITVPSTTPGAAPAPSSQQLQPSGAAPTGPEVVVKPAPDSAVVVPGPSVIVPAPAPSAAPADMGSSQQMQQAPGAAVAPVPTAPAQPGGIPSDVQMQKQPRTWAPGGFVEPPRGPDLTTSPGATPPPGPQTSSPLGRSGAQAPGTSPITLPSTSVVVPGQPLPAPAMPGGMPAAAQQPAPSAVQQPAMPPSAVQPAPPAQQSNPALVPSPARPEATPSSQPSLPSDQQGPDIIIITPVPQGSTAPGTMK